MYKIFRENKQTLPGDEEFALNQKPSIRIVLLPLQCDNTQLILPKLNSSMLILQPNMGIEILKKYLKEKFKEKIEDSFEVSIYYRNIEMMNHYTIRDIERIYLFTGEKTIFYYSKSNSKNLEKQIKDEILLKQNQDVHMEETDNNLIENKDKDKDKDIESMIDKNMKLVEIENPMKEEKLEKEEENKLDSKEEKMDEDMKSNEKIIIKNELNESKENNFEGENSDLKKDKENKEDDKMDVELNNN